MTETMLVRAAGGSWEELRPQTTMPAGGILDVFGRDIGPVLGVQEPVLVVACEPALSTGTADGICVDPDGGIWIIQLALDGDGAATLPQLIGFGGALTGMSYDGFEQVCEQRNGASLAAFVASIAAGSGFHPADFEQSVADALAHGRFHLVAIVRDAAQSLVQSMRFLNASGAKGMLYEASSFAGDTISAVRAKAVDVGSIVALAVAAAPATPSVASASTEPAAEVDDTADIDRFLAAVATETNEATVKLMSQMYTACSAAFEDVAIDGAGVDCEFRVLVSGATEPPFVVATADGSVVVSFEALGDVDPGWSVRAELCQGMERLLGADLGDVRKISQLNLSIAEHLMDATLMEALTELLADTAETTRGGDGADGVRIGAHEPAAA